MKRPTKRGSPLVEILVWLVAFGTVAATIAYSLGPAPAALNEFPLADKVFHICAYAAMTAAWLLAAVWRPGRGDGIVPRDAPAFVVCAVLLGAAIEIAQDFGDRSADPFDALSDAVGAILGLAAWAGLRSVVGRRGSG
jgi:VanZ family protein